MADLIYLDLLGVYVEDSTKLRLVQRKNYLAFAEAFLVVFFSFVNFSTSFTLE